MCVVYDWSLTEARHPLLISEGLKCPSERLKCPNLGQSLVWCSSWWSCSAWQTPSQVSISLFQYFICSFLHTPPPSCYSSVERGTVKQLCSVTGEWLHCLSLYYHSSHCNPLCSAQNTQLSAVPSTTAGGPRKVSLSLLSLVELE